MGPADVESTVEESVGELLILTKMNWNATQLDGRLPITLGTEHSIGDILKHLLNGENPAPRYAHYMQGESAAVGRVVASALMLMTLQQAPRSLTDRELMPTVG